MVPTAIAERQPHQHEAEHVDHGDGQSAHSIARARAAHQPLLALLSNVPVHVRFGLSRGRVAMPDDHVVAAMGFGYAEAMRRRDVLRLSALGFAALALPGVGASAGALKEITLAVTGMT
jgi:hypothetical protein